MYDWVVKYRGNQLKLLPPLSLIEYIALSKCFNLDGYTCVSKLMSFHFKITSQKNIA